MMGLSSAEAGEAMAKEDAPKSFALKSPGQWTRVIPRRESKEGTPWKEYRRCDALESKSRHTLDVITDVKVLTNTFSLSQDVWDFQNRTLVGVQEFLEFQALRLPLYICFLHQHMERVHYFCLF